MGRIAAIVAVAVVLGGTALGAQQPVPTPPRDFGAELIPAVVPKQLSHREPEPVEFRLSGVIRKRHDIPPALRKLVLELDRNASLDVTGLPACGRRRLEPFDTTGVEAACRDAIVGRGTGEATIAYPENTPVLVESELVVFNGGMKGRIARFFIRGTMAFPNREVIIGTVKVKRVDAGRYGLRATTTVPSFSDGVGYITDFSLWFKKHYGYEGERRGIFYARCVDGRLQARTTMTFDDGSKLFGVALRTCGIKH